MSDLESRVYELSQVVSELGTSVKVSAKEQEHLTGAIQKLAEVVSNIQPSIEKKIDSLSKRVEALEQIKWTGRGMVLAIMLFGALLLSSFKEAVSAVGSILK